MTQNGEEEVKIKLSNNKNHHDIKDKDRASPPLSSHRSRHSSLSFVSNKSNLSEFDINDIEPRRKTNSRLSFADEQDDYDRVGKHDRSRPSRKSPENKIKNLLKSELSLARENMSDSDGERRDHSGRRRDGSRETLRERSRSKNSRDDKEDRLYNHDKSDRGLTKDEKGGKHQKMSDQVQLFEIKFQPIGKIVETFREPKNLKKWTSKSIKGGFYFNEKLGSIVSNSFALDLKSDSTVFFAIEPFKTSLHSSNFFMC